MKRFSITESRVLVGSTWILLLISGFIAYLAVKLCDSYTLAFCGLLLLATLWNYARNSEYVPVKLYSAVPAVFRTTFGISLLLCLIVAFFSDNGFMNANSLALGTICLGSFIAMFSESYYA
jgi:hypothetical protein